MIDIKIGETPKKKQPVLNDYEYTESYEDIAIKQRKNIFIVLCIIAVELLVVAIPAYFFTIFLFNY